MAVDKELTGKQVIKGTVGRVIGGSCTLPASYETYRRMRKHPTIAIARALSVAPIIAAEWSVEADNEVPDEIKQFVEKQFFPIREAYAETCLYGGIDFGHAMFEKVFGYDGGQIVLRKLKPLLQDNTTIQTHPETGAFIGFSQGKINVPIESCLLVNFRVEGTNWYGEPLLENCRETWNKWCKADDGAARYDAKVAGSHWVVHYPNAKAFDAAGVERPCSDLAWQLLQTLESSGSVMIPEVADQVSSLEKNGWKIELISDKGSRQPGFIDRENYLDKLLVRGLLMPERALLEGQYGTKAEAGAHIDLALTLAENDHKRITRFANWHVLDDLLAVNFGEAYRGKARLKPSPIADDSKQIIKELYAAILANPTGFMEEYGMIDTNAIKDLLKIPKHQEEKPSEQVAGVEAYDPAAETVREVYADPASEVTTTENVQQTALNSAQIASIIDVAVKIKSGELSPNGGLELLKISFPSIPAAQIESLVKAL
jgi:hypothetical protein